MTRNGEYRYLVALAVVIVLALGWAAWTWLQHARGW